MRCRGEAHTTQTKHRHWWRAAGSTTPQLPECAEDGYPGKGPPCTRPAHSPVPPTLYCPVGKSVAGLLNSSGPPLLSLALEGQKRPRWRLIRRLATRAPATTSSSHHSNVSLSQIDQKLLSGRSHLSSSAAHGLLRMLPFLGCGSNETSILDLT